MELFSVACITCRAKLKVTHVSAIGQILACPKCGSMVPIDPPPGWKPPPAAASKPAPATQSGVLSKPPAGKTSASKPASASAATNAPAQAAASSSSTSVAQTAPADSTLPSDSSSPAASYTAEPFDDEPLSPPGMHLSPSQQAWRQKIVVVAALAAGMIVSLGLWWTLGDKRKARDRAATTESPPAAESSDPEPIADEPVPESTGVSTETAADLTAAILRGTASVSPTPSVPPSPSASATPDTLPTSSSTAVALASASPSAPLPTMPPPSATPLASAGTPTAVLPTASPPIPPLVPVQASTADVEAKLAMVVPKLAFDQSLRLSIETIAALAGLDVTYDWDSPGLTPALLAERHAVALDGASLGDILRRLLEPRGLQCTIADGGLVIGGARPDDDAPNTVEYAVADLASQPAQLDELTQLVKAFVAPASWDVLGGRGTISVADGKLSISQSPAVHREVALWLDRLRLARGKSPVDPKAVLATRAERARTTLAAPVTMNFRPAAALNTVLAHLEASCQATITVDHRALAALGYSGEPVGIAAADDPLSQTLSALCDAHGWAWRIVDERTFEITSREALARRPYCEFYDLRPLVIGDTTAATIEARLVAQLADVGWRADGGIGRLHFDTASGRLLVWHHQAAQQRIERMLSERDGKTPARAVPQSAAPPPLAPPAVIAAPSGTRLNAASLPAPSTSAPTKP